MTRWLGSSALFGVLLLGCAASAPPAEVVLVAPARPPPTTIYGRDPPAPPRDDPPPKNALCAFEAPRGMSTFASDARRCYVRSLSTNPSLSGRVVIALRIDAQGNAIGRIESSTLNDPSLEACLVSVFSSRPWPCATGDVKIPLAFAPPVP